MDGSWDDDIGGLTSRAEIVTWNVVLEPRPWSVRPRQCPVRVP